MPTLRKNQGSPTAHEAEFPLLDWRLWSTPDAKALRPVFG